MRFNVVFFYTLYTMSYKNERDIVVYYFHIKLYVLEE